MNEELCDADTLQPQKVTVNEVYETAEQYRANFAIQFRTTIRDLIREAFDAEDFCDKLFLPFNTTHDFTLEEHRRLTIFAMKCEELGQKIREYINAKRIGNLIVRTVVTEEEPDK